MNPDFHEFHLSDAVREKLCNKSHIINELKGGKKGQEIIEFSDETMQKLYKNACHLLEEKKYSEASCAFLFLGALSTQDEKNWIGLGMSLQFEHDYETAIDAYEMAALCDVDNPIPYLYLAKCFFAIHERDSALQAFDMAIEKAEGKEQYAVIKEQAEQAKKLLI